MKKTLLILCALVCGTLAFAQTYSDNLHVIVNGDDEGVKEGNVTIAYQDDDKSIIDFTLHNFSVDIYMSGTWMSIDLGDVTVYDIELGAVKDGVASFSCTDDHNVKYPDIDSSFASLISSITVNMTGDLSETKLHASMNITVSVLIFGDYPVTANFGYDNDYGEYLIVNVSTGNYLGGGLDWGTHATEIKKPQFFSITDQPGGYYIYGNQGGFSIGYDKDETGLYVDGANPIAWEFIDADDGSGYYIACDDGYLTGAGSQKAVTLANTKTNAAIWKFVTLEEAIAGMDEATISEPVDVTALIPAPEPKNANWGNSWVTSGYGTDDAANNVALGGGSATASCAESWHSSNGFDVRQTIPDLPAGFYTLTAQAFYRNDGGTVIPSMYITTGTNATDTSGSFENVHLPELSTEEGAPNDMASAYKAFLNEDYPVSLPFIVDAEGETFTIGFESNTTGDDQMWSIFGELGLLYMGTELPTLTAVTGKMNADVQAAMTAALAAYNVSQTSANFLAAEQAIIDAEESVAYYAVITEGLESEEIQAIIEGFDADGQSAFENGFYAAYTAGTLTDETLEEGLAAACKAQTTAGSDMSYALLNSGEWTHDEASSVGNFQICPSLTTAHEAWRSTTFGGSADSPSMPLYKEIEDLPAGNYTISFYAYAAQGTEGDVIVFANDATSTITVDAEGTGPNWNNEDELITLTCKVEADGVLQFGLKCIGAGAWYVAQEVSLTLVALAEEEDPYIYDITSLLANPSFEDDDVSELTADSGRGYAVTELTGWILNGPNGDNAHKDLMTAESTETDNNYGAPGTPSDGTYMLYLRDAWAANTGSVMQSIVLPAGEYKITVDSKCVAAAASTHSAKLVVGEESTALNIHTDSTVPSDWDTAVLEFILTEITEVSVGVQISFGSDSNGLAVVLDNFQLFSTEEVETVEYANDVTWALANPSFEVDNVVENLEVDGGRGYSVTTLTGWDLSSSEVDHCDLMTKDATETDNNLGVPSAAADGTYWLYLKKSWGDYAGSASVKQTVTLPAGDYRLTVQSMAFAASATAKLVAGDASKSITINGTSAGSDTSHPIAELTEWTTNDLVFTVEAEEGKETEVELGVDFTFPTGAGVGSILIDNFKLYSVDAIEKEISWTMTEAGWGTMILPFAATLEDGLTAYSCNGTTTDEETETTTVDLTEVGTSITANTPYVIEGTAGSYSFRGTPINTVETYTEGLLTGTLVDLAVGTGAALATDGSMYVLQNHVDESGEGEGLAFYPITEASAPTEEAGGVTLDAYHCYLDLSLVTTSLRPVALHFPGAGEATAIEAVESDVIANDAIYDLSGRRVSKAVKGVYIQNGKKVLVK